MRPRFPVDHCPPPAAVPSCGVWLLRWLLVLLIVCDQVGSPLHRHHHDSGIDGYALTAVHDHDAAPVPHVEDEDDGLGFSHAVMAVRPQPQLEAIAADEAGAVALGRLALAPASAAWVIDRRFVPRPDARPASHRPHRSLPPAGRAPPLHA